MESRCIMFESRPLACRFADLEENRDLNALMRSIQDRATELSRALFLALCGNFSGQQKLSFPLMDVVSGKFVEAFFHILSCEIDLNGSSRK